MDFEPGSHFGAVFRPSPPLSPTNQPQTQHLSLPDVPVDPATILAVHERSDSLLEVCRRHDWDAARILLTSPDNISTELHEDDKKTALHYACEVGNLEIIELLLERGADVSVVTRDGLSVLNYPSVIQNTDLLKTLLYHVSQDGIPVNTGHDAGQQTPLMLVCGVGDTLYVSAELLLTHGASPDGSRESRPLIVACEQGDRRIVELLIAKGANINVQDENGNTGLLQACRHYHFSIVYMLIEQQGIKLDLSDTKGTTPLFEAISINNYQLTKKLITKGAKVNAIRHITTEGLPGSLEQTPLAYACSLGLERIVDLLIDRGAIVNYRCSHHVTPLCFAVVRDHAHIVRQLLKCNELVSTIWGLSYELEVAISLRNYKCVKLLIDHLGGKEAVWRSTVEYRLEGLMLKLTELPSDLSSFIGDHTVDESLRDKSAALEHFCHFCISALKEYEIKNNITITDLAMTAQVVCPGNPEVSNFLSRIANHSQPVGSLGAYFVSGLPSPLTFLISNGILTSESVVQEVLKCFDEPDEFYTHLIGSFRKIRGGENLPDDIQSVFFTLFNGLFQINIRAGLGSEGMFPPNSVLPPDFQSSSDQSAASQSATPFGANSFPPDHLLPSNFQSTPQTSATPFGANSLFPSDHLLPPDFRSTPQTSATPFGANSSFPPDHLLPPDFRSAPQMSATPFGANSSFPPDHLVPPDFRSTPQTSATPFSANSSFPLDHAQPQLTPESQSQLLQLPDHSIPLALQQDCTPQVKVSRKPFLSEHMTSSVSTGLFATEPKIKTQGLKPDTVPPSTKKPLISHQSTLEQPASGYKRLQDGQNLLLPLSELKRPMSSVRPMSPETPKEERCDLSAQNLHNMHSQVGESNNTTSDSLISHSHISRPSREPSSQDSMSPHSRVSRPNQKPSSQDTLSPHSHVSKPSREPSSQGSLSPHSHVSRPSREPSSQGSLSSHSHISRPSREPSSQDSSSPHSRVSRPNQKPSSQNRSSPHSHVSRPSREPSSQGSLSPHSHTSRPSREPSSQHSLSPHSRVSRPNQKPSSQDTLSPHSHVSRPSREPSSQDSSSPHSHISRPSREPSSQDRLKTHSHVSRPSPEPSSQNSLSPHFRVSSNHRPSREPSSTHDNSVCLKPKKISRIPIAVRRKKELSDSKMECTRRVSKQKLPSPSSEGVQKSVSPAATPNNERIRIPLKFAPTQQLLSAILQLREPPGVYSAYTLSIMHNLKMVFQSEDTHYRLNREREEIERELNLIFAAIRRRKPNWKDDEIYVDVHAS